MHGRRRDSESHRSSYLTNGWNNVELADDNRGLFANVLVVEPDPPARAGDDRKQRRRGTGGAHPLSGRVTFVGVSRRLDSDSVEAEIFDLDSNYIAACRAILVDLVRGVQEASRPHEFMRAQLEIRDALAGRQQAMTEFKTEVKDSKRELKNIAGLRPQPRAQVRALQERIAGRERQLLREEALRHVHRQVADALAWRATGHDRAVFAILGQGNRVGRFAEGAGFAAEQARTQELWDGGTLPLINDMTNSLRTGDLTVLHTRWPRPKVGVEEVKASGAPRRNRQSRLRERRLRLLATEWAPADDLGPATALWRLPLSYRHHLDLLAGMLAEARARGLAQRRPHPAMVITAVSIRATFKLDDPEWTSAGARGLGWAPDSDDCWVGSALATRISERRWAGPASLAPVPAFPICAEDVVDLLLGELDYTVAISLPELAVAFRRRGITVTFGTKHDANAPFLEAHRSGSSISVPAVVRDQMLREAMTVDTLVTIVDAMLEADRTGAPRGVQRIVVCDERKSWPRAPVYLAA